MLLWMCGEQPIVCFSFLFFQKMCQKSFISLVFSQLNFDMLPEFSAQDPTVEEWLKKSTLAQKQKAIVRSALSKWHYILKSI